jgi:hypothetical protein
LDAATKKKGEGAGTVRTPRCLLLESGTSSSLAPRRYLGRDSGTVTNRTLISH